MQYFIILLLIFVFVGVFYRYPQLILPLLIFSVPLQRYNYYIESVGLSVQLIIIILPAAHLALLLKKKFTFPSRAFTVFSVLLLIGESLSLVHSINIFRSVSAIAFSCLTLSYAYIFSLIIKTKSDLRKALSYLLIIGSLVSALGIWQFFMYKQGQNVSLPFEHFFNSKTIDAESFTFSVGDVSYLRPSSTFVDVNLTAGFLIIIVLLSFAFLIDNLVKNSINFTFWKYLVLFVLNVSAFLLTVSRSGYLGLAIGCVIFFMFNSRYFFHKRILVMLASILLFGILLVYLVDTPVEAMWGRFQETFLTHDSTGSTQEHQLFSKAAFDIFKQNSLFGIGAGNFEQYYLTKIDVTEDTAYTYNVYLGFLSETGILGFLGQLLFIFFVIGSSLQSLLKRNDKYFRIYYSALLGAFVAILIANLFYAYYILFFVWMLIGLLLTLSLNELDLRSETND